MFHVASFCFRLLRKALDKIAEIKSLQEQGRECDHPGVDWRFPDNCVVSVAL